MVAEASGEGGEHFREVRRERVVVSGGEDGEEEDGVFAEGRFGGGVGGEEAGEEEREGVAGEGSGGGFEVGDGDGDGVAVGEFVEGGEDFLFEVVRGDDGGL